MAFFQLDDICKSYPGAVALKGVSLALERGQIVALIGENGAGKSTLIEIIAGVTAPDSGRVYLNGAAVQIASPEAARAAGIGVVHQHSHLLPDLSIAENRALRCGYPRTRWGAIDWRTTEDEARVASGLLAPSVDILRRAGALNAVERQLVELSLTLAQTPQLLVLDEPTAALPQRQTEALFAQVRAYADAGGTVLFVSHRLEEVSALSQRVIVLRDGALVWQGRTLETDRAALVAAMVGRPVNPSKRPARQANSERTVLQANALRASDSAFHGLDLALHAGELYGLYGLVGSGQNALCQALAGLLPAYGSIDLDGCELAPLSPEQRAAAGLAYVPGDRRAQGMLYALNVGENIALGSEGSGWIHRREEAQRVARIMDQLQVRAHSTAQPVGQLSGGNQQKVLLGRGLLRTPHVLIAEEPTQGVDVGAKAEIHAQLRTLAERGTAVLFVSSDIEEVLSLADRVGVMREGALVDEWPAADAQREKIIDRALPRSNRARETPRHQTAIEPRRLTALFLLNALLAATSAALAPDALQNALDVALNNAVLLIGALAVGCVIMAGSIDISIGSLLGLSAVLAGLSDTAELPIACTAAVALAAGALGGWLNGWMAVRSKVHAIVITLGTMAIYRGLIVEWSDGRWILGLSDGLRDVAHGSLLGAPFLLWAAIGAWIGVAILLRFSRFGRLIYALGSDQQAARYVGVASHQILPWTFALCGLLIGAAGLLQAARYGQVQTNAGLGFELKAIAAAVIGGVHIAGGRGSALGIALGTLLIGQLANALVLLHVPAYWEGLFLGAVILSTLVLERGKDSQ